MPVMSQQRGRAKSHASRSVPERQIPGWLWLLTGMVLGAFIMFLVHLSELKSKGIGKNSETKQAIESSNRAGANTSDKKAQAEEDNPANSELIFEFYDRLKQEQVTVPEYDKPEAVAALATHHYFLQVASFRRHEDADKVRARLILLNMEADVEESTLQSGVTAFRVIVGPYQNKSKLAKARETLVSNGFEYLTLKRKIQ